MVKPISYKCFFALEVKRSYQIHHLDRVTAFLYGFLDKIIYVKQFHLFVTKLNKVCKLMKVIYRLKQASHIWYMTFIKFLKKLGFTQLELDYGIFVLTDKQLFIAVYINNFLIFGVNFFLSRWRITKIIELI